MQLQWSSCINTWENGSSHTFSVIDSCFDIAVQSSSCLPYQVPVGTHTNYTHQFTNLSTGSEYEWHSARWTSDSAVCSASEAASSYHRLAESTAAEQSPFHVSTTHQVDQTKNNHEKLSSLA